MYTDFLSYIQLIHATYLVNVIPPTPGYLYHANTQMFLMFLQVQLKNSNQVCCWRKERLSNNSGIVRRMMCVKIFDEVFLSSARLL